MSNDERPRQIAIDPAMMPEVERLSALCGGIGAKAVLGAAMSLFQAAVEGVADGGDVVVRKGDQDRILRVPALEAARAEAAKASGGPRVVHESRLHVVANAPRRPTLAVVSSDSSEDSREPRP